MLYALQPEESGLWKSHSNYRRTKARHWMLATAVRPARSRGTLFWWLLIVIGFPSYIPRAGSGDAFDARAVVCVRTASTEVCVSIFTYQANKSDRTALIPGLELVHIDCDTHPGLNLPLRPSCGWVRAGNQVDRARRWPWR